MENNLVGIAILLDEKSFNFARKKEIEILKNIGTTGGLCQSPHITVKRPFSVGDEKLEEIENYMEELSKDIEPFQVNIDGFGYFEPEVIYLNIEHSDQLQELHVRIIGDLSSKFVIQPDEKEANKTFTFHSTIAYSDLTEENFYEAKQYLDSTSTFKYSFVFDEIALFYKVKERDFWIISKRCKVA